MSRESNPKIVGAFVLGAVALIVVVFVIFGSGRLFQTLNTYVMYFRGNVKGLKVGSSVLVRGVEIGTVSRIQPLFSPEGELFVEVIARTRPNTIEDMSESSVHLSPEEEIDLLVKEGLRAQLNSVSLVTGMLYIKLDFFPETPSQFAGLNNDYIEIPTIPTSGELLEERLMNTLEKFENMPILEITENLNEAIIGFKESLTEVKRLADFVSDIDIDTTLAQLNRTLESAEGLASNLNAQLEPISTSFVDTAGAARETLKSIEKVMDGLEKSAAEERYELRLMLMELSKANRTIRALVDYLQRNPDSLVWGKK